MINEYYSKYSQYILMMIRYQFR